MLIVPNVKCFSLQNKKIIIVSEQRHEQKSRSRKTPANESLVYLS